MRLVLVLSVAALVDWGLGFDLIRHGNRSLTSSNRGTLQSVLKESTLILKKGALRGVLSFLKEKRKCPKDRTYCETLNRCVPLHDCSRCINAPNYNKGLDKCVAAPVPLAVSFCGADDLENAVDLTCQNYATSLHNCINTCNSNNTGTQDGSFINCLTGPDSPCPTLICEKVCRCIGEPSCKEPCMGHCVDFRENVLKMPEKFASITVFNAYMKHCVFKEPIELFQESAQTNFNLAETMEVAKKCGPISGEGESF